MTSCREPYVRLSSYQTLEICITAGLPRLGNGAWRDACWHASRAVALTGELAAAPWSRLRSYLLRFGDQVAPPVKQAVYASLQAQMEVMCTPTTAM